MEVLKILGIILFVVAVALIMVMFLVTIVEMEQDLSRIAHELIELKLNFWKIVFAERGDWNYGNFPENNEK